MRCESGASTPLAAACSTNLNSWYADSVPCQHVSSVCAVHICRVHAGGMQGSTVVWSKQDLGCEQALAAIAAADGGDLAFEERDEQQVGARVPPPAEPAAQRRVSPRLQDVCRPRQRSMRLRLQRWRQGGVEERLGVRVHRQLGAAGQARPGAPLVTSQLLVRPAGQERPHERVHLRPNLTKTCGPCAKGTYASMQNSPKLPVPGRFRQ